MSTSKSDIADRVAERVGTAKGETSRVVSAVIETVADALVNGETIRLHGLGTFNVKDTQPRTGRNPVTGESISVPAGKKVTFKAADDLKRRL